MEAEPLPSSWKTPFMSRPVTYGVVGGLVLTAAAGAVWWRVSVMPERAASEKRYQSTLDIAKMYGLQLTYKREKGAFANDLASLLSVDPNAAALEANLAANVDMNTLAVVGDADKFKIELNVLDGVRTPIKVRGPIVPRVKAAEPSTMPAQAPPMNADGAPIGR